MIPPPCTPGGDGRPASAEVRTHIRESLLPLTEGFGLAFAEAPGFDCRRERAA